MAIFKPLKHRVIPRSYSNAVLTAAWIYGAVTAAVFVADFKSESWRKHRGLLSTIAGFILPLFDIICMYINMYAKVTLFNIRRQCYSLKSFYKRENNNNFIQCIMAAFFHYVYVVHLLSSQMSSSRKKLDASIGFC